MLCDFEEKSSKSSGFDRKNRGDRSGVLINFQNFCPGRWTAAEFDAKLLLGLSSKKPTMDTFRRPWTVFSLDDFLPKTMTTLLSRGLYILFLCSNDSYLFLRKEILSIYVHYLIFYLIYAPGRMIAFIWAQNSFFVPPRRRPCFRDFFRLVLPPPTTVIYRTMVTKHRLTTMTSRSRFPSTTKTHVVSI